MQSMPVWFTVNGWPAIVAVSSCDAGVPFGATVTATRWLPVPDEGVAPRPVAVHAQDGSEAATVTIAVPPAAVAEMLAGLIPNEQLVPNCVIVETCPWTVMVAV